MNMNYALALTIVTIFATGPVLAEKPTAPGKDHKSAQKGDSKQAPGKKQDTDNRQDANQRAAHQGNDAGTGLHGHFDERSQAMVRDYYGKEVQEGRCPPGLAKKNNSCMPPGQAKNWAVGEQLPRDVIFHNLPTTLATQFGQPPAGHRYVRVADEVLLITSVTGKVIDSIPLVGIK